MKPLVLGLSRTRLTDAERALFEHAAPAGYILFQRNIETPEQLRALTAELRALSGRERLPILVDQEGGRVARLRAPHWPEFPPARAFGDAFQRAPVTAIEAARLNARALAAMLADVGITVDCLPVLDLADADTHPIVGDRAFAGDPDTVSALGDATLRGLAEGGVIGVVKHVPGHGRATVDSHAECPLVTADRAALERDVRPFRKLAAAPMAMVAHIVYTALDAERPASQSPTVVDFIRRDIGFTGLLLSDDIGMAALSGDIAARMAGVLAAGCDIALACSGDAADNERLCAAAPDMTADAIARLDRAMASAMPAAEDDVAALGAARDRLLAA